MIHAEWDGLSMGPDDLVLTIGGGGYGDGGARSGTLPNSADPGAGPTLDAAGAEGRRCLVRSQQLGEFLIVHRGVRLVCFDAASLHWTIENYLRGVEAWTAWDILWGFSRDRRIHDVRIFDQLFRLNCHGGNPPPGNVEELARSWTGSGPGDLEVTGDERVPGIATAGLILSVYLAQKHRVEEIPAVLGISPKAVAQFGPLALGVQVQGAIALGPASRIGLRLRRDILPEVRDRCRDAYREDSERLEKHNGSRGCFSWSGGEVRRGKSGHLETKVDKLRRWLEGAIASASGRYNIPFEPPRTPAGEVSTRPEFWGDLALIHPEIRAWSRLCTAAAVERALDTLGADGLLHPRYEIASGLVSLEPNLDATRRLIRSPIFEASPGFSLVVGRLPDLVLRCHAEICERLSTESPWGELMHGESQLGGLFRAGVDPTYHLAQDLYSREQLHCPDAETLKQRFRALESGDPAGLEPWMTLAYSELKQEYDDIQDPTRRYFEVESDGLEIELEDRFAFWLKLARKVLRREFERLESERSPESGRWIKVARALLDAVPRGLAAPHLRELLRRDSDIDISRDDSDRYVRAVVDEILPELGWFIEDRTLEILAERLGCGLDELGGLIVEGNPETRPAALRNLISGKSSNSAAFAELRRVCRDGPLGERLATGTGNPGLYDEIFDRYTMDAVGRIRRGKSFTRAHGAQHLDTADDVLKSVLYRIVAEGNALIAFAGDEFVIQVAEDPPAESTLRRIEAIAEAAAREVLVEFPPRCEVRVVAAW